MAKSKITFSGCLHGNYDLFCPSEAQPGISSSDEALRRTSAQSAGLVVVRCVTFYIVIELLLGHPENNFCDTKPKFQTKPSLGFSNVCFLVSKAAP
jgi:hypothetical protein